MEMGEAEKLKSETGEDQRGYVKIPLEWKCPRGYMDVTCFNDQQRICLRVLPDAVKS